VTATVPEREGIQVKAVWLGLVWRLISLVFLLITLSKVEDEY